MNNAICLDGPAKGQEFCVNDGRGIGDVPITVKRTAIYAFNHVDNGKLICKFIGMQKEFVSNDILITEEMATAIMEAHNICHAFNTNPVNPAWGALLKLIHKTYPKIFNEYFWRVLE